MKLIGLLLCVFLFTGCASAPPQLGPAATAAYHKTQAIKALDLLRDTAIAANAQTPPLVSTADTRQVVLYHQSALRLMDAASAGWPALVRTALDETLVHLAPEARQTLQPYVALVQTVLQEVQP